MSKFSDQHSNYDMLSHSWLKKFGWECTVLFNAVITVGQKLQFPRDTAKTHKHKNWQMQSNSKNIKIQISSILMQPVC